MPVADGDRLAGAAPRLPYGHPDLIVGRAVARRVIDAVDGELILVTRLQRVPLRTVAGWLGVDEQVLRMRRRRAEHSLVDALRAGLLSTRISPQAARQLAARHARRARRRDTTATCP
jgi:aminoglycoside phosphotransferase family enzyme